MYVCVYVCVCVRVRVCVCVYLNFARDPTSHRIEAFASLCDTENRNTFGLSPFSFISIAHKQRVSTTINHKSPEMKRRMKRRPRMAQGASTKR